ncbi:hypothetical protein QF017_002793 [Pseudomonas laurylsulfatiphila]|nr:hypothetical protein [Pseudomonas reinekei]
MSYPEFVHSNIQLWERACPRKRWVSQHLCKLTLRLRGQARSHRGICGGQLPFHSRGLSPVLRLNARASAEGLS